MIELDVEALGRGRSAEQVLDPLLRQLSTIDDVQVWLEDKRMVKISGVGKFLPESASECVKNESGWLMIKKENLAATLRDIVSLTILCSDTNSKVVSELVTRWRMSGEEPSRTRIRLPA